ncbi:MAG: hypothetical protein AABN34_14320 [Acidobacteriota bacterium]
MWNMTRRTSSLSSKMFSRNHGKRYAAHACRGRGLSLGDRDAACGAHRESLAACLARRRLASRATAAIIICAVILLARNSSAQQQDQTRGLHVKKLEESRPASTTPRDPQQPRTYRSVTGSASSSELRKSASASEAVIGVTLWRLRPVRSADNKDARILEHQASKTAEWSAERIEADTRVSEGERVRVSIESPSTGYLYVIDREQYADGSLGDAYLIFPTSRTRGGNNSVVGGRVIEFPAQEDNPPYFTLTRSRPEHSGEVLILIVAPQPLADLPISSEPVNVPSAKLAQWEKEWGGRAEQFELEGGAGLPYTKAEKSAGGDGSRMLTQADPLPQTILRLNATPSSPVLVKVLLRIAR